TAPPRTCTRRILARGARSRAPRQPPSTDHFGQYFTLYSGLMRTYRRLMGFLRPYRRELWGSLVFAWVAMGMTVLIPWLIGRSVNAIETGEKPELLPLALAIVGAGVLRLGLTMVRRV